MSEYAGIHLIDTTYCIDNAFDYYIPPHLRRDILCGDFVTVPFGTANRKKLGVVVSLKDRPDKKNIDCKPILSVCDRSISLSEEALGLCFFIKEQTLCTVGDAVRAMVPASVLSKLEEIYKATDTPLPDRAEIDPPTLLICEYIRKKGSVSFSLLKSKFGPAAEPSVKRLTALGLIVRDFAVRSASRKLSNCYSLAVSPQRAADIAGGIDGEIRLRSQKQHILEYRRLF